MADKKGNQGDTSNRGFASMDDEKQREIARKGGEEVSKDREHMADIGRKGGEEVSKDREHMAEIGRKGGESSGGGNRGGNQSR
jgi:uncharacterized protein